MADGIRILHLDDDVSDRELVARALAREEVGYELTQVSGIRELKPLLETGAFDLVLTDYDLGDGDGLEALNLVRARWPDIPVILVTGSGSEEIAIAALRHGANDYLLKSPDYIEHLPLRVRAVLKAAEARRRLKESEARFTAFMDHSPAVAFMKDQGGTYIYANRVWSQAVGSKYPDPVGHTDAELYDIDVEEEVRHNDRLVSEQGSVLQTVERIPDTEGRLREWLVVKFPVPSAGGNLLGGIALDLTEQRELELAAESAREVKERVLDSLPASVVLLDRDGVIVETNRGWREYAEKNGFAGAHLALGDSYLAVCRAAIDDEYASRIADGLEAVLRGDRAGFSMDYPCAEVERPDAWYRAVVGPARVEGEAGAVVFHLDVTDQYRAESELAFIANNDPLTGLPNRNFIRQRTDEAIARARRDEGQLAVLFLDIDGFRTVNDSLGQESGDILLKQVAERLRGVVREGDVVGRLGADEYAILLDDITDPEDAGLVAGKLSDAIREPVDCKGQEISVTMSIGIACFPNDGDSAEKLLTRADTALNEAKSLGYNTHRYFSAKLNQAAMDNLLIQNSLRLAVEKDQLRLVWQPIVDLSDGHIIGAETLLRWDHPELGLVPPAKFIPVAERIGVIGQLGDWVLDNALARAAAWREAGLLDAPVSVNLSMQQFRSPDLTARITGLLERHGLEGRHLVLELTESMLGANPKAAAETLAELKARGIRTAVDDFGTGYSSLNYLKAFPLDTLKIDRSFVMNIVEDKNDQAIAKAIIGLARYLGLRTVAEGIEKAEQAQLLKTAGCDAAQGYWFSMPLSEEDFEWLLRQKTALPVVLARKETR